MGHLDEQRFADAIAAPCAKCGGTAFDIDTYIDRQQPLMLGDADREGKWAHDGEKFVDGVVRIACAAAACGAEIFASGDCPRCHRAGALAETLTGPSRLVAPKKCPTCKELELIMIGFAPARVRVSAGGGRVPTPVARALYGETGFHAIAVACDACGWAQVAEGCPLCGASGPLRARP